jgi:hypothetical protein
MLKGWLEAVVAYCMGEGFPPASVKGWDQREETSMLDE